MKVTIEDEAILQSDGSVRRSIRVKNHLVGFYDPRSSLLEMTLVASNLLLEVIKAIGDKFGAVEATKAFHSLRWIYPSNWR